MPELKIPSSYDIIGSKEKCVAIVEIPEGMKGKEKEIAQEIMKKHKNVVSVLAKESARDGELRLRKYKLIAGDEDTEVLHKEHGYMLRLDPQKTYFSAREGTERQRIASQVKPGEVVIVMFSGIAPFPVAICKKQPDVEKVIAVELNEEAVEYAKTNIRINKLAHKIKSVQGDVRKACEPWYGKCDRIVMPLPKGADKFLDIAIKCAKPGATIHFYSWGEKGRLYENAEKAIDERFKSFPIKYKITDKRVVLPYSPGWYKVCVEIKVSRK